MMVRIGDNFQPRKGRRRVDAQDSKTGCQGNAIHVRVFHRHARARIDETHAHDIVEKAGRFEGGERRMYVWEGRAVRAYAHLRVSTLASCSRVC